MTQKAKLRIKHSVIKKILSYKVSILLGTFLGFWTYVALCLPISNLIYFKNIAILLILILFFVIADTLFDQYIIKKKQVKIVSYDTVLKAILKKLSILKRLIIWAKQYLGVGDQSTMSQRSTIVKTIYRFKQLLTSPKTILTDKKHTIKRIILFSIPLIIGWTFYMIAFYPGLMSPDSINQWKQVQDLSQLADHHPYIHTMTMYLLTRLYNSPAIITATQILLMSLTYGVGLELLYRRKLNKIVIYCILFFMALAPSYGITNVTLWKDIWFAAFIFWTTVSLLFLLEKKKLAWLMLSVSMILVAVFRHNGTYVVYVLLPILFFLSDKKSWLKIVATTGVSLFILLNLIPSVFNIGGGFSSGAKYSAFNRYIGYVLVKYGTQTDPELVCLAKRTMPVEVWTKCFYPYRDRYAQWACPENPEYHKKMDQYDEYYPELIIRLVTHYPTDTFHIFKKVVSMIWSIRRPEGTYLSYYKTAISSNNFGFKLQENFLTEPARIILIDSREFDFVFYRGGVYVLFLLYTVIKSLQRRDYHYIYMLLPILLGLGTLLVVLPAQDYRYIYFMPFAVPFLVGLFLTRKFVSVDEVEIKYEH